MQYLQSTETELWENASYGGCPSQQQTAVVSAIVLDPSGIALVQLSWSVGSSNGTVGVPLVGSPGVYSVTIGPFADSTLSGGDAWISLQMTAYDTLSNSASVSSSSLILLNDCVIS